jgi:predicted choloylglycine hydrolase
LTVERHTALATLLATPGLTLDRLIEGFLTPPLYSRRAAFPTVYTAVYRPTEGRVDYLWPGRIWSQRIARFEAGDYVHDYGELGA